MGHFRFPFSSCIDDTVVLILKQLMAHKTLISQCSGRKKLRDYKFKVFGFVQPFSLLVA